MMMDFVINEFDDRCHFRNGRREDGWQEELPKKGKDEKEVVEQTEGSASLQSFW